MIDLSSPLTSQPLTANDTYFVRIPRGYMAGYSITGTWDGATISVQGDNAYSYATHTADADDIIFPDGTLYFILTGAGASTSLSIKSNTVHNQALLTLMQQLESTTTSALADKLTKTGDTASGEIILAAGARRTNPDTNSPTELVTVEQLDNRGAVPYPSMVFDAASSNMSVTFDTSPASEYEGDVTALNITQRDGTNTLFNKTGNGRYTHPVLDNTGASPQQFYTGTIFQANKAEVTGLLLAKLTSHASGVNVGFFRMAGWPIRLDAAANLIMHGDTVVNTGVDALMGSWAVYALRYNRTTDRLDLWVYDGSTYSKGGVDTPNPLSGNPKQLRFFSSFGSPVKGYLRQSEIWLSALSDAAMEQAMRNLYALTPTNI